MADNVMTLRLVVRKLALDRGLPRHVHAQAVERRAGVGHAHPHVAVRERCQRLPRRRRPDYGLSKTAKAFIAGLLCHAREFTAVTNQLVNSYKRLVAGDEAPTFVSWARNNRSALVRVPVVKPGKESSTRVEYRALDSAANPYLAFSAVLAAGLKGVQEGYELPDEAAADLYTMNRGQGPGQGIRGAAHVAVGRVGRFGGVAP